MKKKIRKWNSSAHRSRHDRLIESKIAQWLHIAQLGCICWRNLRRCGSHDVSLKKCASCANRCILIAQYAIIAQSYSQSVNHGGFDEQLNFISLFSFSSFKVFKTKFEFSEIFFKICTHQDEFRKNKIRPPKCFLLEL